MGVKGNPGGNRFLDSDVIVAEVRETSRKPDEIYHIIERLSPSTRKLGSPLIIFHSLEWLVCLSSFCRVIWTASQFSAWMDNSGQSA